MQVKKSFAQYPRPDSVYEQKSSLDFDMMRTKIFEDRRGTQTELYLWIAHAIIGFITGFIAFCMTYVEDYLIESRKEAV